VARSARSRDNLPNPVQDDSNAYVPRDKKSCGILERADTRPPKKIPLRDLVRRYQLLL
jgi:hypothetical protein